MRSLDGEVFIEPLQASLIDAQNCLYEGHHTLITESKRSQRPCTLDVGDFVVVSTKNMPRTNANQDPSRQKLQLR